MGYLITNQRKFNGIPYPCPSYPKATVKSGGCGPCSILNCVENMTDLRFKMARWISYVIAAGGRIDGGTNIPAVLKALKRDYGFDYEGTNNLDKIKAHLKAGGMGVFHVGGQYSGWEGLLSTAGHYVCLAGITTEGKAIVIDSDWYTVKYTGTWRADRCTEGRQDGIIIVSWDNMEKDKKYRNNQGANYYLITAPAKKETEESNMAVVTEKKTVTTYETLNDIPSWGKPSVEKVIGQGFLKGTENGKIDVTEEMLRILVILDRAGQFGEDE